MTPPLPPRLALPQVTVCAVDGRSPGLALTALKRCAEQADFGALLLVSDEAASSEACAQAGVECARVGAIASAAEYSRIVLRELPDLIRTEHVLIVQWDGFVCDASAWRPEFLDYDYIGAPWIDQPPGREVGNGGFSLRSRRLMEAGRDPRLVELHPEDATLCVRYRQLLEDDHGIRFAPVEVARRFAYENRRPKEATFGFHGPYNLPDHFDEATLGDWVEALPLGFFSGRDGRRLLRALVQRGYYRVALEAGRRRIASGRRDLNTLALTGLARLMRGTAQR